jgi:hypothetical protein
MAKIAKTIDFVKLPFPLILKRTYLSLSLSNEIGSHHGRDRGERSTF